MFHSLRGPARPAGQLQQIASVRCVSQLLALAAAVLSLCAGSLARAQSDSCVLDTTFDRDGKVTTNFFAKDDAANDVAIQSDGKIVVAGGSAIGFALARYHSDGSLDRSFGQGGRVITRFGLSGGAANAVAIQPDGKIVAAGTGGDSVVLARYQSDGSLDTTFGDGGKVITSDTQHDFHLLFYRGNAIALQPGGKIVIAGYVVQPSDSLNFALFRYNSDGSLDTTFGNDGIVDDQFQGGDSRGRAVVIQPDGKIVVAGDQVLGGGSFWYFVLQRFNADGSVDSSFGSGGQVKTNFVTSSSDSSSDTVAYDLVLQSDGKLIAAGGALTDIALARYNPDGSLDNSFGMGGKVTTSLGDSASARAVLLQPDSKIVAAGETVANQNRDFALARYNPDGSLDTTFGVGGKMSTDFFGTADVFGKGDQANAVARQSDGKIIAVGFAQKHNSEIDFALARYSPNASSNSHDLLSLALSSHKLAGCQTLQAVVTLCGAAPPGGVEVMLSDTLAAASVPATVTVPEGETSVSFEITTTPVSRLQLGLIEARVGTIKRRMPLVVRPVGVQSVLVSNAFASSTVPATVTLECAAPSGGVEVTLASRNPAIASPTTSRIFIPAGNTSGGFSIRTGNVTAPRMAIIQATANGVSKSTVMRVAPHP